MRNAAGTIIENLQITPDRFDIGEVTLEVRGEDPLTQYAHVELAVKAWLEDPQNGYLGWVLDPSDMARVGVGITADGKGAGSLARFFVTVTRDRTAPEVH